MGLSSYTPPVLNKYTKGLFGELSSSMLGNKQNLRGNLKKKRILVLKIGNHRRDNVVFFCLFVCF